MRKNIAILTRPENMVKAIQMGDYLSGIRFPLRLFENYEPAVFEKDDLRSISRYLAENGAHAMIIDDYSLSDTVFEVVQNEGLRCRYPFISTSFESMGNEDMVEIEETLREMGRRNKRFKSRLLLARPRPYQESGTG